MATRKTDLAAGAPSPEFPPSLSVEGGAPAGLSSATVALLQERLPDEALKQHPTKAYLTTINAAFVIERLNLAFGTGMWSQRILEHWREGDFAVVRAILQCPGCAAIETFGGNDNKDPGDALKGAQTDALTKAAAVLGVGAHVWKNDKRPASAPAARAAKDSAPAAAPPSRPASGGGGGGWRDGTAKYDGSCAQCGAGISAGDCGQYRKSESGRWERRCESCARSGSE